MKTVVVRAFCFVVLVMSVASSLAQAQPVANSHDYSRKSKFEYYGVGDGAKAGLLKKEWVEPDNADQCVETEYIHDAHGNKTGATTRNCAGAGGDAAFTARSSSSAFDSFSVTVKGVPITVPAGQFARSSTNAVGHSETRSIDPRFGTVVSLKGPNDLTTGYEVDDWGRVVRENRADGTSTRSFYCLVQGRVADTSSNSPECGTTGPLSGRGDEIPSNSSGWRAVSYVHVQSFDAANNPMGPAQRSYKDAEGRAIREITAGFDGASQSNSRRWIVKDTVYTVHGVVQVATGTYFLESGSPATTGSGGMALTTTVIDALGRPTAIYQRDPQGKSSASFGAYGSFTASRTVISYSGLTTDTANDLGQTRKEEKNANGLVVRITDADGAQLAHQHDAFGNLIATKDALQNTITLSHDIRGRKLSMSDPSTGTWTYGYNALGELRWQRSPNQTQLTRTNMDYDRLGRMVTRTEPEYTSTWTYDSCAMGKGKLCASGTDHGVAKTFAYDGFGRPVSSRMAVNNGGPSLNTALSYDGKGRVDQQTYPTGLKVQYHYTALGFVREVRLPQAIAVSPERLAGESGGAASGATSERLLWSAGTVNARGQSEASSLGNGLTSRASFEGPTGRIEALSVGAGGSTNVAHHAYVWDGLGNLKTRTDQNGDGLTGAVTDTYQYDALNRLVQYRVVATNAGNLDRAVELHYNAIGNLLYKSDVGNYIYPNFGSGSQRPHAVSQVVMATETRSYVYDAAGNAVTATAGKWQRIDYTSFNLPTAACSKLVAPATRCDQAGAQGADGVKNAWGYDENHQRIKEERTNPQGTRTTWYLHPDNQGGLGFETESTGSSTNLNRHYLNAGGQMVVLVTRQALSSYAGASQTAPPVISSTITAIKLEFWHKDHLGSTIATSDHAGSVTARYAYDPFGKRRVASGQYDAFGTLVIDWVDGSNKGTDRGFTGHEHLDELGLIHMNGRIFDPTIARFLQADPFIQAMEELQNYNRYSYCYGNPLNCTDPSGQIFKWLAKKWREEIWRNPYIRTVLIAVVAYYTGQWALNQYASSVAATSGYSAASTAMAAGETAKTAFLAFEHAYAAGYAATSSSVAGGAIAGAAGGFAGGFVGSNGDLKAGFQGAATGALSGGLNNFYGSSYSASRVIANGVAGGMGSILRGDGFKDGFRSSAIISSLAYLNAQMREEMIAQSRINSQNDGTGFSRGMNGDGFKLAGGRWFDGANPEKCSILGCWQSGTGSVFGRAYSSGGFIDMVTESFAGPHDKANSFWWYVNRPQQVLNNLGMIGDALPTTYHSPFVTNLLEYTTNYTTSLIFALPFASAAVLEQSWVAPNLYTHRRRP